MRAIWHLNYVVPAKEKISYLSKETLPIYNEGLVHVSVSDFQNKTSGIMQAWGTAAWILFNTQNEAIF